MVLAASDSVERLRATLADLHPDLLVIDLADPGGPALADALRAAASRAQLAPRLLILETRSVEDMMDGALALGEAAGLAEGAQAAVTAWRERLHRALDLVPPYLPGPRVAVIDGVAPLRIAGRWVPQLVERAGGEHPLLPTVPLAGAGAGAGAHGAHRVAGASREISPEDLLGAGIEAVVVAPSDGAPDGIALLSAARWWAEIPAVRAGRVVAVDGPTLATAGPRLVDAQEWFVGWLQDRPGLMERWFGRVPGRGRDVRGSQGSQSV